ncbi:MAG: hypothetical protein ACREDD_13180 [Methylocella sp.]
MYFAQDQLEELNRGHSKILGKFADLREKYFIRNYQNARAREYATHGFGRRLGTLVRCIDRVFEILPPDLDEIPSRDEVTDATVNIQAFVFNIFGCCDNLAWIWVLEKAVLQQDGNPLEPKMVGLGTTYSRVRLSFSQPFRSYLDSREQWFTHIKEFRDTLAHHIPLYIPPYIITPDRLNEYERLGAAANEAARLRNFAEYDRLTAEQDALGRFQPWMTYSPVENAPAIVFHFQLLSHFNTIDEIGRKLLEEMER